MPQFVAQITADELVNYKKAAHHAHMRLTTCKKFTNANGFIVVVDPGNIGVRITYPVTGLNPFWTELQKRNLAG